MHTFFIGIQQICIECENEIIKIIYTRRTTSGIYIFDYNIMGNFICRWGTTEIVFRLYFVLFILFKRKIYRAQYVLFRDSVDSP